MEILFSFFQSFFDSTSLIQHIQRNNIAWYFQSYCQRWCFRECYQRHFEIPHLFCLNDLPCVWSAQLPLLLWFRINNFFFFSTEGTSSFGKRHNKSHTLCKRCGRRSFHIQKHTCASCGYPAAKTRSCKYFFFFCCDKLVKSQVLTLIFYFRQLGWEGQEKTHHWYRSS